MKSRHKCAGGPTQRFKAACTLPGRYRDRFCLILKYQLYPVYLKQLAERIRRELELPVDSPKALEDGKMRRFVKWHNGNM